MTYSTTFPVTESPISEGGNWKNGAADGLDWNNCLVPSSGFVCGQGPSDVAYSDPTAVLKGAWGANQTAMAVVRTVNQNSNLYQEVELRLRSAISAHSCTGYEVNFRCLAGDYSQIVRWNGALANFTVLSTVSGIGVVTGDIIYATIKNNVINVYKNGLLINTATDNTFATGNPGIGFDYGCDGTYGDFEFTSFFATDANVVYAASTSQADVQTAINAVGASGIVIVPAGSSTWSGAVTLAGGQGGTTPNITLQGNGIGSTNITSSAAGGAVINSSGNIRVTGISFLNGAQIAQNDGLAFRVDHCIFTAPSWITTILIQGTITGTHPVGLVDHCTFTNSAIAFYAGFIGGAGFMQSSNQIWAAPLGLGTNNALFMEDNSFVSNVDVYMYCFDCNGGSRFVFRHNTIQDMHLNNHGVQSNTNRGARSFEIYNNVSAEVNFRDQADAPVRLRAGTGVVFNNQFNGTWTNNGVCLDTPRANPGDENSEHPPGMAFGATFSNLVFSAAAKTITGGPFTVGSDAGTIGWIVGDVLQVTGSASNDQQITITGITAGVITASGDTLVDESAGATVHLHMPWDGIDGYPALDQPGVGISTGVNTGNTIAKGNTYYPQTVIPIYGWNNTYNGAATQIRVIENPQNSVLIQSGRDYINGTSPPVGYTPYAYPHPLQGVSQLETDVSGMNICAVHEVITVSIVGGPQEFPDQVYVVG